MLQQGLRFVLVGGFNTAVTYAIYCVLVIWWHPQLAWFTVFMIGLAMGFVLHTRVAFRAALARHKALAYLAVQLFAYAFCSAIIHAGITWFGLGPRVAAALAIAMNVPLSFVLSRRALSDRPPPIG
jgi:putative flippase GtrA